MKYLMGIPDVYTFMTKYLNDSRHVLFNTSMVTDDVSSSLKVALMLTSLSSWTTMLSFAVKQGPLIFTFVPPNINRVIWWEILLNKKKADECNAWVTYNGKMALEFQLQLAMTEISARNCLDESGHSLSAKSLARLQTVSSNVWGRRKIEDVICTGTGDNEEPRPISSIKPVLQFKVKFTVNSIHLW